MAIRLIVYSWAVVRLVNAITMLKIAFQQAVCGQLGNSDPNVIMVVIENEDRKTA